MYFEGLRLCFFRPGCNELMDYCNSVFAQPTQSDWFLKSRHVQSVNFQTVYTYSILATTIPRWFNKQRLTSIRQQPVNRSKSNKKLFTLLYVGLQVLRHFWHLIAFNEWGSVVNCCYSRVSQASGEETFSDYSEKNAFIKIFFSLQPIVARSFSPKAHSPSPVTWAAEVGRGRSGTRPALLQF